MTHWIPLDDLRAHPDNSNVMPAGRLDALRRHIASTGRYPPLIVRPHDGAFQLLDGHHRAAVLRELDHERARCDVWDIDDDAARVLLATLNRLEGVDDPRRRGALLAKLAGPGDADHASRLAALLPDRPEKVKRLIDLAAAPPKPRPPRRLEDMPVSVHFFLQPAERSRLEAALRAIGGGREAALLRLVDAASGADRPA